MNRRPIQVDRGTRGILGVDLITPLDIISIQFDTSFGSPQYGQIYQIETKQKLLCEERRT